MIFYFTRFIIIMFIFIILFFIPHSTPLLIEWELIYLPLNVLFSSFLLDITSIKFILVVRLISIRVLFYSKRYIDDEFNSKRFIFLVLIFIFRIFFLILGARVPLLLLGWDGLGLSSYFLIVHYQNFKSSGRGLITVIRNRIGDIFIITSRILIISEISSLYFYNSSISNIQINLLRLILILGAITKRAIFPYSVWLPEAIAAPTPVSSLVHSSTLVTAGVYLLLRTRIWFPSYYIIIIGIIRSFTLLLSRGSALFCLDFKKVIALSTLRQLSFILVTLSLSLYSVSFFHLITHALFKSSLFIAAGSFIHLGATNQDIRFMDTSNITKNRLILISIPILALRGLIFLAGFFRKETIIISSFSSGLLIFITLSIVFGALLTILYSIRILIRLTLPKVTLKILPESLFIDISKLLLISLSIFGGWIYLLNDSQFFNLAPNLNLIIQSLFIFVTILWASNKLFFNPYLALHWNQFNYLGRVTNTLFPNLQIFLASYLLKVWEGGWQEVLGPKTSINIITWSLNKIYKFSTFEFYIFISIIYIIFIFFILFL